MGILIHMVILMVPSMTGMHYPEGYASNNADCDDTNANVNPAHPEVCNGLDDNCDGQVDNTLVFVVYYTDIDGDGNGDPTLYVSTCDGPPVGYVLNDDDCDDENKHTLSAPRKFVTRSITIVTG
ncbi:MAG: putative metal-binding motif-containing protein [Saprospiraceae bacterium]|nr:putative metal-binding motif-containing protein [Saprospiraceae bacterium]